ncbi:MAG: hypothetical protein PVI40_08410 [Chlamydiota bacterium]|jgi:hypothetical protein
MKKIIFCLILLIPLISFADHFTVDQQMFFSELDEKYSKNVEDKEIWALYIRTFGKEKVMVRFPNMPKLKCLRPKHFCVNAKSDEVTYRFFVEPLKEKEGDKVLQDKLASIKNAKNLKVISEKFSAQNENKILDIEYQANWLAGRGEKTLFHMRILSSQKNTYILVTQHPESSKNEHFYFINSFEIIS